MPRSYPAPVQQNLHRSVLVGILALGTLGALPCRALAQAYDDTNYAPDSYADNYNTPPVDGDDDDAYYNSPDYIDEAGIPYAGRDLGYDYLDNEYYRYDGQPVQDRRAREQDGWRDGVLHTPPRGYRWRSWYDRAADAHVVPIIASTIRGGNMNTGRSTAATPTVTIVAIPMTEPIIRDTAPIAISGIEVYATLTLAA